MTSLPANGSHVKFMQVPREPTEDMLNAARDWSVERFPRRIGNEAAIGCWQAMYDAVAVAETRSNVPENASLLSGVSAEQISRIQSETIEACAKIAELAGCGDPNCKGCYGNQIASAIRAACSKKTAESGHSPSTHNSESEFSDRTKAAIKEIDDNRRNAAIMAHTLVAGSLTSCRCDSPMIKCDHTGCRCTTCGELRQP